MRCILPSITSIGMTGSSWRDKILEIEPLKLNSLALFVTCMSAAERQECYDLLAAVQRRQHFDIPFVHAVSDMPEAEFQRLQDQFGTERFNLHPLREYPLRHPLSARLRERIYIENATSNSRIAASDLEGFAGLCVDLSHLEDLRRNAQDQYNLFIELALSTTVGANHISAVKRTPHISNGRRIFSNHVSESIDDFNYLFEIPAQLFSPFCAIELENSITEQLALIDVIQSAVNHAQRTANRQQRKAA